MAKNSVYQIVTNWIVDELEKGVVPWKRSWSGGIPKNFLSGKMYRGINPFVLNSKGYASNYWITKKQARSIGGDVPGNERYTPVIFWKREEEEVDGEKKRKPPILLYYRCYNILQCEGIEIPDSEAVIPDDEPTRPECESIVHEYVSRENSLNLDIGRMNPSYSVTSDTIRMPDKSMFDSIEDFYVTYFHEIVHSTGHRKRLNRKEISHSERPIEDYSREELVAEMGASFLASIGGIHTETREQSASYIQGWLRAFKDDSRLLAVAGAAAQRAVDYVLGIEYE